MPVAGGVGSTSIKYRVSTDVMQNAMGAPLTKLGVNGQTTHNLVGGCLTTTPPGISVFAFANVLNKRN